MHVTKLCFMMRELKRNLLSHITQEYFPNPQMACQYILSCFSKWEWFFHQPSTLILLFKKSVSHTICDHNTQKH